ncbi:MAG: 23S rRNA (pseudouridine(1915)-N(3))-methyltransferase RlmH [Gammaproteobacteria bacterium]|mgnify:FL=1|tara:strand:- start:602 stop:1069 length:468 start_codon:yes stop_codon:yes gene_type:complete
MKIRFISIESSRPEWAKKAFTTYESKFNKSIDMDWLGLKPVSRTRNYNVLDVVEKESNLLQSKIKKHEFVIALDKEGMSLSSEKLRFQFDNWISSSKDISIIIGGPDGLSQKLIRQSDFCWSLSQLTFPHSIVPVIVVEQIYRVWSMTQNHPYHK